MATLSIVVTIYCTFCIGFCNGDSTLQKPIQNKQYIVTTILRVAIFILIFYLWLWRVTICTVLMNHQFSVSSISSNLGPTISGNNFIQFRPHNIWQHLSVLTVIVGQFSAKKNLDLISLTPRLHTRQQLWGYVVDVHATLENYFQPYNEDFVGLLSQHFYFFLQKIKKMLSLKGGGGSAYPY